jgi:hypothetical protein
LNHKKRQDPWIFSTPTYWKISTMAALAAKSATKAFQRTFQKELQDTVVCRWWTGNYDVIDPAHFLIDAGGKLNQEDLKEASAFGQEIKEKYNDTGVIHVQNTGLADMNLQRLIAKIIMGDESEYEGGANPRGRASDLGNVYDIGAPLEAHLHYHHEMTYKSHSVESLGFLCKHAVTERPGAGWTFVSDSVQAHDLIIQTDLGQKLKDNGLCFIRKLTDADAYQGRDATGVYNHWQKSWMTDDPAEAQEAAEKQGLQVEWIDHPHEGLIMQTRYYKSAFEYIPALDRNIMVTSIADDGEWFDAWPGLKDVPQEQRPMDMLFGDDTPISLEEKQLWTDTYDHFGIPIAWQPGDVAVVCNMRFAHGRPGIELLPGEKRELGVMLGPLFERQETREDRW